MSFSDMMSSGRGPGVIGMVMALIVLLGFGVLFMFAFDEGFQGADQSIEALITHQAKDISDYQSSLDSAEQNLALAPQRLAAAKELARLKRENTTQGEKITALNAGVAAGKDSIAKANEAFEDYKDGYRAQVRGQAKGQTMDQLETTKGVVYKNVNIREVTAIGIQIRHEEGQKRIPFEELPAEMKDRFQFDPNQKEKALADELATRKEHEAAVDAANDVADKQMDLQREKNAEAAKERKRRDLAVKESRVKSLMDEIKQLSDALRLEERKTVSRGGVIKGQIASKQRDLSELRSQVAKLQSED